MSKERLEEFRKEIDFLDDSADMQDHGRLVDTCMNLYEDGWFHWIYRYAKEQAERVDELERKNYDLREDLAGRHSTVEELNEKIDKLWIQNKCYREAIQEAMELNHDENFNYDVDKVLLKAWRSESHE